MWISIHMEITLFSPQPPIKTRAPHCGSLSSRSQSFRFSFALALTFTSTRRYICYKAFASFFSLLHCMWEVRESEHIQYSNKRLTSSSCALQKLSDGGHSAAKGRLEGPRGHEGVWRGPLQLFRWMRSLYVPTVLQLCPKPQPRALSVHSDEYSICVWFAGFYGLICGICMGFGIILFLLTHRPPLDYFSPINYTFQSAWLLCNCRFHQIARRDSLLYARSNAAPESPPCTRHYGEPLV